LNQEAKVTREISPQALQDLVKGRQEFALLDVRALAEFVKGHLWLSIHVPQDSIQSRIGRFVPRQDTDIVLIDQDQGLA
jgi:rhodanese-related sulfurtransferase